MMPQVDPHKSFWKRVDKTDTCWLWTGGCTPEGYGHFATRTIGQHLAHRWSYEQWHGPIPKGLQIDHLCRVRNCVNPAHLEAVTPKVNQHRGMSPIGFNARKTHCQAGHEFTPENTYTAYRGFRKCRTCAAKRAREAKQRRLARLNAVRLEPRDPTTKEATMSG